MLLYEAYQQIGVSMATLAYYFGPVIVIAVSPLLFKEQISKAKLLGFAAVLTGMFFTNCSDLLHNGFSWGLLCGILAAVMYAVMVVFNKMASGITGLLFAGIFLDEKLTVIQFIGAAFILSGAVFSESFQSRRVI